jgi:hypothetical protein
MTIMQQIPAAGEKSHLFHRYVPSHSPLTESINRDPIDDFDGTKRTHDGSCQPDLPLTT